MSERLLLLGFSGFALQVAVPALGWYVGTSPGGSGDALTASCLGALLEAKVDVTPVWLLLL